jgi:hypothetical protein
MERTLLIEGTRWRARALPDEVQRAEQDGWHLARVRFEPVDATGLPPRETWLRLEEDLSSDDVLDQYEDEELAEAFLVAEEITSEA